MQNVLMPTGGPKATSEPATGRGVSKLMYPVPMETRGRFTQPLPQELFTMLLGTVEEN